MFFPPTDEQSCSLKFGTVNIAAPFTEGRDKVLVLISTHLLNLRIFRSEHGTKIYKQALKSRGDVESNRASSNMMVLSLRRFFVFKKCPIPTIRKVASLLRQAGVVWVDWNDR